MTWACPRAACIAWLAQAKIDAGQRDGLTTDERLELQVWRRELRVVRESRRRQLLCDPQEGADLPARVAYAPLCPGSNLQLHRRLVQPATPALHSPVRQPRTLRGGLLSSEHSRLIIPSKSVGRSGATPPGSHLQRRSKPDETLGHRSCAGCNRHRRRDLVWAAINPHENAAGVPARPGLRAERPRPVSRHSRNVATWSTQVPDPGPLQRQRSLHRWRRGSGQDWGVTTINLRAACARYRYHASGAVSVGCF